MVGLRDTGPLTEADFLASHHDSYILIPKSMPGMLVVLLQLIMPIPQMSCPSGGRSSSPPFPLV